MWIIVFSILLLLVAYFDICYRVISNKLVMLVSGIVLLYTLQFQLVDQWLYSIPVLVVGLLLWKLGVFGAGDVKLLTVLVPVFNPDYHLLIFLIIAFSGGIVAMITLLYAKLISRNNNVTVPYGVSIALGCWLGILASL